MKDHPPSSHSVYRRPPLEGWDGTPRHRRVASPSVTLTTRRWPRRVLIGVNLIVAICLVGTASAYGYVQWRLGQIHRETLNNLTSAGGGGGSGAPFTLLIVGSDSRAALSNTPGNVQFGGTSAVGGQRSDTVILARVVPASHQIMIMSIPRDLWVNIPGQGQNRINSAFDSGPNLLIKTIQQDLGIPINHYIEVNFDTFRDISSAVGGVSFYFPTPARDTYSLLSVGQAGCVSLSGDQALAFVRARHYEYYQNGYWHSEAQSDLARIQRQQAFIKKMLKKAEGEFTNPIALNNVVAGITKNLTVDRAFSSKLILEMGKDFHSIDAATIPTLTLPNYSYVTAGGADVLGLQEPQAAQTIAAFKAFGQAPPAAKKPAHAKTPTTPAVTAPRITVAPASVSIEVANGTGTAGQAAQMTQTLAALKYTTVGIGTSPGYGHATTQILYAPDSLTAAQQLAAQIPGGGTLIATATLTPSPYNIEIVTGSSYTPGPSGSSTTTGSTSTNPSTTLPGTNTLTYVLPGQAPGQVVPSC